MQSLAQAIQSQGRGNDTMLVHMTPNEVGGLQTLANNFGGSLTTNPSTGLPEAGFLDSILPMVAGFALAPVMGPVGAALAVGGGTTVITGDIQKGLSAGLGAYGGASFAGAGGVPGPGEQIAGSAATPPPIDTVGATAQKGLSTVNPLTTGTAASDAAKLAADSYQGAAQLVTPDLAQANQVSTVMDVAGTGTPPPVDPTMGGAGAISQEANLAQAGPGRDFVGSGLQGQMIDPTYSQALQNFSFEQLGQAPKGELIKAGLASVSPYAFQEPEFNVRQTPATIRPFRYDANPTGAERAAPTFGEGQRRYFNPKFTALPPYRLNRRDGGIVNLNTGGSPSRFLRGAGDGVSDSIPATVNQGERPAALSDGEYVIDARGVAEIGNGSSEAGARKLTEMMNRIHNARRKADKGEDMNADRFLLA